MTKKKPDKLQPKRSARKKFDVPIDPEIEAWSKKLFHPVKPIIDGLKEQAAAKTDSDTPESLAESDFISSTFSTISSNTNLERFSSQYDSDFLSETVSESDTVSKSESDSMSTGDLYNVEFTEGRGDRSLEVEIERSGSERKSVPDNQAVQTLIGSATDAITDPDRLSGSTTVAFVQGELRIPNYLLKGLLATLSSSEFVVYLWLYFLSYGFGKSSCYVSVGKLASAVNLTDRTVFRMLNSLEARGLIRRANRHFLGKAGGITFDVFLPETENLSATDNISETERLSGNALRSVSDAATANKDHDHDLKRRTDHERKTIALYQDLTGNPWTPADDLQYVQIRDLPAEVIERNMRLIANRAAEPIRSFAYFAKSLRSQFNSPAGTRPSQRRLQTFINEVRALHTGGRLTIADLEEAVRARCEASGVAFDKALFNELATRR
ncbi:MAG: helix-turn-helix domain-containing protein [Acidobacteriota bacterium]